MPALPLAQKYLYFRYFAVQVIRGRGRGGVVGCGCACRGIYCRHCLCMGVWGGWGLRVGSWGLIDFRCAGERVEGLRRGGRRDGGGGVIGEG